MTTTWGGRKKEQEEQGKASKIGMVSKFEIPSTGFDEKKFLRGRDWLVGFGCFYVNIYLYILKYVYIFFL